MRILPHRPIYAIPPGGGLRGLGVNKTLETLLQAVYAAVQTPEAVSADDINYVGFILGGKNR